MVFVGSNAGPVLIRPWILAEEDIGVLETLEEDLETAWFRRQGLLLTIELAAVPEGIVEGFRREPDDVGIGDEMGS